MINSSATNKNSEGRLQILINPQFVLKAIPIIECKLYENKELTFFFRRDTFE